MTTLRLRILQLSLTPEASPYGHYTCRESGLTGPHISSTIKVVTSGLLFTKRLDREVAYEGADGWNPY